MRSVGIRVEILPQQFYAVWTSQFIFGAYQHVFGFFFLSGSGERVAFRAGLFYESLQRRHGGGKCFLPKQVLAFLVQPSRGGGFLARLCCGEQRCAAECGAQYSVDFMFHLWLWNRFFYKNTCFGLKMFQMFGFFRICRSGTFAGLCEWMPVRNLPGVFLSEAGRTLLRHRPLP